MSGSIQAKFARYWRVYRSFFLSSFARELEFRANFFAKVLQNFTWAGFFLLVIAVIYSQANDVAGWKANDALLLSATGLGLSGLFNMFFFSLTEIPQQVRLGTLDFVVTKPADPQFWVSIRRFNFNEFGVLSAGVILLAASASHLSRTPSAMDWLAYSVLSLSALLLMYAMHFSLMTLGIWFVRVDNLWALGETAIWSARYPLEIYSLALRRFFLYVMPLAFLCAMPASMLVKGANWNMVGLGCLWAVVALTFSRILWRIALRSYSSASS